MGEERNKDCGIYNDTLADWGPTSGKLGLDELNKLQRFRDGLKKLFQANDAFLINRELEYDGQYIQINIHVTIDGKVWPDETFHDMLEEVLDEITEEKSDKE